MNNNPMQFNQTIHPKKFNNHHSSSSPHVNSLASPVSSENSESSHSSSNTFSRIITQVSQKDELKDNLNINRANVTSESQLNLKKTSHLSEHDFSEISVNSPKSAKSAKSAKSSNSLNSSNSANSLNGSNSVNSDSHKYPSDNAVMVKRPSNSRSHQTIPPKSDHLVENSSERKWENTMKTSQKVSERDNTYQKVDESETSNASKKDEAHEVHDDQNRILSEPTNFFMTQDSDSQLIEESSTENFVIDERNATLSHGFDGAVLINSPENQLNLTDEIQHSQDEFLSACDLDPDGFSKQPKEFTMKSESDDVFSAISQLSKGVIELDNLDHDLPKTVFNEIQTKLEGNPNSQSFTLNELEKFFDAKLNGSFNARDVASTVPSLSAGFQSQAREVSNNELLGAQPDVTTLSASTNLSLLSNNNTPQANPLKQAIQISTPIQDEAFKDVLAERVVWLGSNQVKSASIFINPKDLGPVNIQIQYDNHKGASVQFQSEHLAVRDAIEMGLPRLREIFHEQGINLAETRVTSDNANQFQQNESSGGHEQLHSVHRYQAGADNENLDANVQMGVSYIREPIGLVDYYA